MAFTVEIDSQSGFCFGVVKAVEQVEKHLSVNNHLYSLGDIVHNACEVNRLEKLGLETLTPDSFTKVTNATVLFRAHGEPPASYAVAKANNLHVIDATCPVVLKLQRRILDAWREIKSMNGQIVIYGKKGHPEVIGLLGQTNNEALLVEHLEDVSQIDFTRPVELFSQTTKSISGFQELSAVIERNMSAGVRFVSHDTICRQVANRAPNMVKFALAHDVIVFVGGAKSSNAKILFNECLQSNPKSYFVSDGSEINQQWFDPSVQSVGVCGATSTPQWLLEQVANQIVSFNY